MRFCALLLVAAFGCDTEWIDVGDSPTDRPTELDLGTPFFDGGEDGDPEFVLGQALFFDRELSGNRNVACATCHVPFSSTTETLPLSIGEGGTGTGPTRSIGEGAVLPRNTSGLFLSASSGALFWDGRVERNGGSIASPIAQPPGIRTPLEALVLVPINDREEMRGQPGDITSDGFRNELADLDDPIAVAQAVFARVIAIPEYAELFHRAYPGEAHGFEHIARAIVHFQLELWDRRDSAWDRFDLHGEPLEPDAQVGSELFFGDAGCSRCHSGEDFGGDDFHNLGIPAFGPGKGDDGIDEGRFEVTGDPADRFAFRVPPLRNTRLTGPWMHNGAYATLEGAVRHHLDPESAWDGYALSQLPESLATTVRLDAEMKGEVFATVTDAVRPLRPLTELEIHQLLQFLKALDGDSELLRSPSTAVPIAVPSGLPVDVWPGGPHPFR